MMTQRRTMAAILVLAAALMATGLSAQSSKEKKGLERKLAQIVVDHVEFEEATLPAVIEYLKKRSKELDPDKEGVNIILMIPSGAEAANIPTVTLDADDLPLGEMIRYLCMATDCHYRVESHAVIIAHKSQDMDRMETRTYRVSPGTAQTIIPPGAQKEGDGGGEMGIDNGVSWPPAKK